MERKHLQANTSSSSSLIQTDLDKVLPTNITKPKHKMKGNSRKIVSKKACDIFLARNQHEWRKWLEENSSKYNNVWLVYYRKHSNVECVKYNEALDEALCFGWIDSTVRPRDEDSYMQYFAKRTRKSKWSKKNKNRIEELIGEGKMTKAGLDAINMAKENGMWDIMNDVYEMVCPPDLEQALEKNEKAKTNFESFSVSRKTHLLGHLFGAKRKETREKRLNEIVGICERNERTHR